MPKIIGTPAVRFNMNNTGSDEDYIVLRFRYGGHRFSYSVGAKISPKLWSKETQRVKAKNTEHRQINRLLSDLERIVLDIYNETEGKIEPEDLRKEILYRTGQQERPKPERCPTLVEFAHQVVAEKQRDVSIRRGTWKVLLTVANYLSEYSDQKEVELTFEQIDHNFAQKFKNWMFDKPREFSNNYAAKVFSVIRQFMREAERRKLHANLSYREFTIKKQKVTQIALTFDELEQLHELDLSDNQRLQRVRDLFLIGCYTGLRYSDFSRIEPQHIKEVEGEKMLQITTKKTGETVVIPFFPIVGELLEKYDYHPPKISSQKMNDYLKELCRLAGLTDTVRVTTSKGGKQIENDVEKCELVTTHVARRSFATNLYRTGFPAISIMKVTGHKTERQFMQYIQVDGELNARQMAQKIKMITGQRHLRKAE